MPLTSAQIEAKIDKLEINLDRLDSLVNGNSSTDVTIDTGVLPSWAKFLLTMGALPSNTYTGLGQTIGGNVSVGTGDAGQLLEFTGTGNYRVLTFGPPGDYANTHLNLLINTGTRGWVIVLSGQANEVLWPGNAMIVQKIGAGSAWRKVRIGRRWRPEADVTIYASATGQTLGNTDGLGTGTDGLSSIQAAVNLARDYLDVSNNRKVVVQVADGTWAESVTLWDVLGVDRGGYLSRQLAIRGNLTTPANVLMTAGTPCFKSINSQAGWVVEGFRMTGQGGIQSDGNSFIYCGKNEFGTSLYHVLASYRSLIEIVGDCLILTNCSLPWEAKYQSQIIAIGNYNSVLNPATSAWASARFGSAIITSTVFSNLSGATGTRYYAGEGSVIDTAGGGANYFPGNAAGYSGTGYYS